ncbi:hypothetical protein [Nonomuraea jiangxiensis]|uniref:Uncharacterized protein n=1 Tax=Nonomuraea jiangxiensis TaxID=633440 RepID=A0A1G8P8S1_9ACTN|nr:hypothetical protein [Nonomuraea jiangxiensis]SDI88903.1 hypothetical protein SAMN05421869_107368 [Nonomuraea jiangxiensis]
MREGVKYVQEHQADLFFVTIDKSEDRYSPTRLYHEPGDRFPQLGIPVRQR